MFSLKKIKQEEGEREMIGRNYLVLERSALGMTNKHKP